MRTLSVDERRAGSGQETSGKGTKSQNILVGRWKMAASGHALRNSEVALYSSCSWWCHQKKNWRSDKGWPDSEGAPGIDLTRVGGEGKSNCQSSPLSCAAVLSCEYWNRIRYQIAFWWMQASPIYSCIGALKIPKHFPRSLSGNGCFSWWVGVGRCHYCLCVCATFIYQFDLLNLYGREWWDFVTWCHPSDIERTMPKPCQYISMHSPKFKEDFEDLMVAS
jgi:hypothetical protein